jgi:hypothetical protein
VPPASAFPRGSAASIVVVPILPFTQPPGLTLREVTDDGRGALGTIRCSRTSGVQPMTSSTVGSSRGDGLTRFGAKREPASPYLDQPPAILDSRLTGRCVVDREEFLKPAGIGALALGSLSAAPAALARQGLRRETVTSLRLRRVGPGPYDR